MITLVFIPLFILALISTTSNSLLCQWHISCPSNNAISVPHNSTNTTPVIQNTTITKLGKATQSYSEGGQYIYSIILNKDNNTPTGIYSFALLGTYGTRIYVPSLLTNCTITSQINCMATFIVNLGTYNAIEVENDGKWLYAIILPSNITTSIPIPIVLTTKKSSIITLVVGVIITIIAVFVVGNFAYDYYITKNHPEDYYKP